MVSNIHSISFKQPQKRANLNNSRTGQQGTELHLNFLTDFRLTEYGGNFDEQDFCRRIRIRRLILLVVPANGLSGLHTGTDSKVVREKKRIEDLSAEVQ